MTCSRAMVLRTLGGGLVNCTVSYDCQAPIEKTLQSFAVNLTGNPGLGRRSGQARGEKVEVTLQQGNATQPGTMSPAASSALKNSGSRSARTASSKTSC